MAPSYSSRDRTPPARVVLVAAVDLPDAILEDWRARCQELADWLGAPVELCRLAGTDGAPAAVETLLAALPAERREIVDPRPTPRSAPMASAPFVWRADGRPDWGAMWTSFCELALFGGPPHRGPESALVAGGVAAPAEAGIDAVAEIRRGIWETTGLYSEPAAPGWLAITCDSPRMAAWLCATIILENVDARCDEERLLVPADPGFRLTDQVKSVVTVVAKTHHYWSAHTVDAP